MTVAFFAIFAYHSHNVYARTKGDNLMAQCNKYQLLGKLYNYWRDDSITRADIMEAFPRQEKELKALINEGLLIETKKKVDNRFVPAIKWHSTGQYEACTILLHDFIQENNVTCFGVVAYVVPSGYGWAYRDTLIIGGMENLNYLFKPVLFADYKNGLLRLSQSASTTAHDIKELTGIDCRVLFEY